METGGIVMPDICMCTSTTCSRRYDCYRAMARPSTYQTVTDFSTDAPCEMFLEIGIDDFTEDSPLGDSAFNFGV